MAKKILIVDDEPDSVSFIRSILDDNGYESISSPNGVEGLRLATEEHPDLILLDLIMPEKGGISMFQELKSEPSLMQTPVIVVSGLSQLTGTDFKHFFSNQRREIDKESEKYKTPDGFMEKPIDPPQLIMLIKKLLEE
jgi:CheY-like chemotaxis protein